jgi:hypothetical protein
MTIFRYLGVTTVFLLCFACGRKDDVARPIEVPLEAIYVTGGKVGGWWQYCLPSKNERGPHCRIWNRVGLLLWDEEFLPYDGGSLPGPDDIKIPVDGWLSGPDRICLYNRRVLFPRSKFTELKRWLDRLSNGDPQPK